MGPLASTVALPSRCAPSLRRRDAGAAPRAELSRVGPSELRRAARSGPDPLSRDPLPKARSVRLVGGHPATRQTVRCAGACPVDLTIAKIYTTLSI